VKTMLFGAALLGSMTLAAPAALGLTGSVQAATATTVQLEAQHPAMQQLLSYGSQGHWVMTLQADLNDLGISSGPVDGIFGPLTEAGVSNFQTESGLPVTGVANPTTWQDILAGFGLTPYTSGSQALSASNTSSNQGSGSANTPTALPSTSSVSLSLPDSFPTGGSPVVEPSSASGPQGQFTPSVSTIDGHSVVAAYHMIATSYGPSLADNYPYGPTDAYGAPLEDGMIAVDPSVIPMKSLVYVTGYQDNFLPSNGFLGQADDTGGAIQGNRIDIFMNQNSNIISDFGVQSVTVYVLSNN